MQIFEAKGASRFFLFFVSFLLSTQIAHADWINLSGAETAPEIAEIYILDDGVRIELEIYVGDLKVFEDLLPDDVLKEVPPDRASLTERMDSFSQKKFTVRTNLGEALTARLELIELRQREDRYSPFAGMKNPITGQPVPQAPADKRVIYAELFYPFAGERPDTLTISPPLNEEGSPLVITGFLAFHRTVPIIDFRYLSRSETVTLNWDDPWYTKFDNPTLKRHHKDAMMSFLYVEPREVRHEALLRVRDMENWIDLSLEDGTEISSDKREEVKKLIAAFFASKSPLKIDEVSFQPDQIGAEYVAVTPRGVVVIEDEAPLDLTTALVGVILTYRVDALPQQVTVNWQLFSEKQTRVPATLVDPAGPFVSYVEPDDPVIKWENFLTSFEEPVIAPVAFGEERQINLPALAIASLLVTILAGILLHQKQVVSVQLRTGILVVLVALTGGSTLTGWVTVENPFAGTPDEMSTKRIVSQLTKNLHNALRENIPEKLDEALEISVSATNLAEVTQELERALVIEIQGGGAAKVEQVRDFSFHSVQSLPNDDGFRVSAEWTVEASGSHWGHLHRKNVRYNALMEISPSDDVWKLTGITVTSARPES